MNECHYDKRMDFFYNRSNTDTADEWTGTKLVIVLCFGTFFCLFIFFSNSLVIAAVIKNRKFHFPFYYLLANLAAADFFAGIAYVFLMFNTGPVSKTLTVNRWFLRQGLLDTSLTASLTNLLVIAVERHMSIMRMRVHSNLTKKRVTLLILFIWAIAIFMGAVPTLGWNCLCDIASCSSLAPIYSRSYLIFWTVSNLMTFFIMVVVYLRIYMYVKRKTNVLSPHTSGSISRRKTPMKLMKTVMTVLATVFRPQFDSEEPCTQAECPFMSINVTVAVETGTEASCRCHHYGSFCHVDKDQKGADWVCFAEAA
ncbi:Lysophosphatidic acid receptor 3 [Galemys pyrenaicus]|uniref:Lysophosphatidic acid receptor 3 n=1 Tax=Galemys pyrenaicus TaxID=202257 RepID=A0A8J6DRQ9_GALPY|nr:Lysophosphatidic acid receptor 3 [Galemys pyrenaicus]